MEEKTREQIDKRYKWTLEDIYATDEAWEQDYKRLEKLMEDIPSLQKTLTKDEKSLAAALAAIEKMEHIAGGRERVGPEWRAGKRAFLRESCAARA